MTETGALDPQSRGGVGGATCTPTRAWPLAPGEHPDLPRLRVELHEGRPAVTGRKATTAIPPYTRILFSPVNVLATSSPDRLRGLAQQLLAAATVLEHEHAIHAENTGQLDLTGQD